MLLFFSFFFHVFKIIFLPSPCFILILAYWIVLFSNFILLCHSLFFFLFLM